LKSREVQQAELREMALIAATKLGFKECKKCFGTGRAYFDVELQAYKPCDCVLKAAAIFTREMKEQKETLRQKAEKLLKEKELVN